MACRIVLSLALGLPLGAQSVLNVGPNQTYSDIPAAIAAASPGDLVLIAAGSYSAFTLNKGITLRADPVGAQVTAGTSLPLTTILIEIPVGQRAHLEQLSLPGSVSVRPPPSAAAAGPTSLTDVSVLSSLTVNNASLAIRDCTITGGSNHGIAMTGASTLSATQSSISGGNAWFGVPAGILADDTSKVICSDCTISGGFQGIHTILTLGNGLFLRGSTRAWCVDSTIQARQTQFSPSIGIGLRNLSSQPVTLERTVALSNSGAGNSWQGAVQNGLVLGLSSATPLVRGGVFQLDFRSRPGLPVIAHGAFKLDAPATIGFAAQPEWGFATNSVQIALLIADSQGRANAAITVPNSPLLQDLPLWFCGWTEQGLPVQLSPVLGGLIR